MVLELGNQPLSATFPSAGSAPDVERAPLRLAACRTCWWLQLVDDTPEEEDEGGPAAIERSTTIREHSEGLAEWLVATVVAGPGARVLEVASHGNVLATVLRDRDLAVTTVERHPWALAAGTAAGLTMVDGRLDRELARTLADAARGGPFDLVLDTFDLSHRRTPGEELAAIAAALAPDGAAVVEVEHALGVVEDARFDSVRHGHFGYPSLLALQPAALANGLEVVDAVLTPIYGGSLRVVLAPAGKRRPTPAVAEVLGMERAAGLDRIDRLASLGPRVDGLLAAVRRHLEEVRAAGRRVVAYGAPSRAVTLLNAAGIDRGLLPYAADAAAAKQDRRIPGTDIPIVAPARLVADRPDEVLILAWPIADEIVAQLAAAGLRESRFAVALPELRFIDPGHSPA
jgi:C-methyltransferase C-terminal domain/Methyltransferase domain